MDFLLFLGGLLIGIGFTGLLFTLKTGSGVLRIDHSNPEKDVWRFEIDENVLDKMNKKTRIELKIDHKADLSHK